MAFDGSDVTVRRLFNLVPGRRTRRYPLARVTGVELVWLGGEGETRLFELRLRGYRRPVVEVGVRLGLSRRREYSWVVLADAINEAAAERMRLVLQDSLGLAPWDEDQWSPAIGTRR